MIIMPAWVFEETDEGYRVLLGSEPRTDAERKFIMKENVVSCIYAPGDGNPRFAMFTLKEMPGEVEKNNFFSGNGSGGRVH